MTKNAIGGQALKVNLGCGGAWRVEGWVGLDQQTTAFIWQADAERPFLNIDVKKGLPFADNSVDVIFSSHTLEHFTYAEGLVLLHEMRRVLKVGAPLCLVVPDMDIYVEKLRQRDDRFLMTPEIIGGVPRDNLTDNFLMNFYSDPRFNNTCHKYAYNEENLGSTLSRLGFDDIAKVGWHRFTYWPELQDRTFQSDIPHIDGISLCMQARKSPRAPDAAVLQEAQEMRRYANFYAPGSDAEQKMSAMLFQEDSLRYHNEMLRRELEDARRQQDEARARATEANAKAEELARELSGVRVNWPEAGRRFARAVSTLAEAANAMAAQLRQLGLEGCRTLCRYALFRKPSNYEKSRKLLNRARKGRLIAVRPEAGRYSPLVSIIMPVYNTPENFLVEALESVAKQTYEKWELCVVENGSTKPHCLEVLKRYADRDSRVKLHIVERNEGIAAASQRAANAAQGDYLAFVDSDDVLAPAALSSFVGVLRNDPDIDMLYSDHGMMSEKGKLTYAALKPDWSPEFFLSTNYIVHFKALKRSLFEKLGGFADTMHISQDVGLTLKVLAAEARVVHVPEILYFWREHSNSTASGVKGKPEIARTGINTLNHHLQRLGVPAVAAWPSRFVCEGIGVYKLDFPSAPRLKPVVVVPVRTPDYACGEFLALFGRTKIDGAFPEVHFIGCGVDVAAPGSGGFAHKASNQKEFDAIVSSLDAEALVFVSPHANFIASDWLQELTGYLAVADKIGAVGGKVLDEFLNIADGARLLLPSLPVLFHRYPCGYPGFWFNNLIASNVETVSSLMLATRKSVYESVGGLPVFSYGDASGIAYCLKLRAAGYRVVFNPWSQIAIDLRRANIGSDATSVKRTMFARPHRNLEMTPSKREVLNEDELQGIYARLVAEFGDPASHDRYYPPAFSRKWPYNFA